MILELMEPTISLKGWMSSEEGLQKNEISNICVLLGKLMFNIQRYFQASSLPFFPSNLDGEDGWEKRKKEQKQNLKILKIHKIVNVTFFVC